MMYLVRFSKNIGAEMTRWWYPANSGEGGIHATAEELEQMIASAKEAWEQGEEGFIEISDEYIEANKIKLYKIRELTPNYWVLVDNRFDGSLPAAKLNANSLEEAIEEACNAVFFEYGDGSEIVPEDQLVWSDGQIHIF